MATPVVVKETPGGQRKAAQPHHTRGLPELDHARAIVVERTTAEMQGDPDFTADTTRVRGLLVVRLDGTLDDSNVDILRHLFAGLYDEPGRTVVLDLARVPYIDNDGFGALLHIQRHLTGRNRQLVLAGCQEAVRLALSLTRLEVLFPTYPTVEDVPSPRR